MNLINFRVKEILKETTGKVWQLFAMTAEELEETKKDTKHPDWYYYLLGNGIMQEFSYIDEGGEHKDGRVFNITRGEKPYTVGYIGQH